MRAYIEQAKDDKAIKKLNEQIVRIQDAMNNADTLALLSRCFVL